MKTRSLYGHEEFSLAKTKGIFHGIISKTDKSLLFYLICLLGRPEYFHFGVEDPLFTTLRLRVKASSLSKREFSFIIGLVFIYTEFSQ